MDHFSAVRFHKPDALRTPADKAPDIILVITQIMQYMAAHKAGAARNKDCALEMFSHRLYDILIMADVTASAIGMKDYTLVTSHIATKRSEFTSFVSRIGEQNSTKVEPTTQNSDIRITQPYRINFQA